MASMNWLGFSLSPQELPSQPSDQDHSQNAVSRLGFNSDDISGTDVSGECFDLTSDSTPPSLNLPPPFGIFEAFNRNNQPQGFYFFLSPPHFFFCIIFSCTTLSLKTLSFFLVFTKHNKIIWLCLYCAKVK